MSISISASKLKYIQRCLFREQCCKSSHWDEPTHKDFTPKSSVDSFILGNMSLLIKLSLQWIWRHTWVFTKQRNYQLGKQMVGFTSCFIQQSFVIVGITLSWGTCPVMCFFWDAVTFLRSSFLQQAVSEDVPRNQQHNTPNKATKSNKLNYKSDCLCVSVWSLTLLWMSNVWNQLLFSNTYTLL